MSLLEPVKAARAVSSILTFLQYFDLSDVSAQCREILQAVLQRTSAS